RVENLVNQPTLVLAINGVGRDFHKWQALGQRGACALKQEWSEYILQVDDVPASELDKLRLEFMLIGPGRVWIDDVKLFHLQFSEPELVQLRQTATAANFGFEQGQYGECLRELSGYWPRFLTAYAPLPQMAIVNQQPAAGGNQGVPSKPVEKS